MRAHHVDRFIAREPADPSAQLSPPAVACMYDRRVRRALQTWPLLVGSRVALSNDGSPETSNDEFDALEINKVASQGVAVLRELGTSENAEHGPGRASSF